MKKVDYILQFIMRNEQMVKYEIFMIDDSYSIESNDIIFNPYGIWINDDIGRGYYDTSPEHSTFIAYTNISKIKDYTKGITK